jgi:hypothetical protein
MYNALVNCDVVDNDVRDNSLGDYRTYNVSSSAPIRLFRGTGSGAPPVWAGPGSLWMRTDAGEGKLYVKTSGTVLPGWQVVTTT